MDYSHDLLTARRQFHDAWNNARTQAAQRLDGDDLADMPEVDADAIMQQRIHCGACTVDVVTEQLVPVLRAYIETLERAIGIPTARVVVVKETSRGSRSMMTCPNIDAADHHVAVSQPHEHIPLTITYVPIPDDVSDRDALTYAERTLYGDR